MGYYLNIGSGQRPFKPPFLNYDIQEEKWQPFTVAAGCYWLEGPWPDKGTVDMVVFHHCIEHFGCGEADQLITYYYDLLAPGGSMLVFVPDIRILARRWLMNSGLSTQVFMTNVYGPYDGDEASRHKWGYDAVSMREYLNKWNWSRLTSFNWREIEGADLAKDYYIIGMEGVK